jgi:phosphoribosylformimino-5-aminoimidazole carboxamide ribotide isomerase
MIIIPAIDLIDGKCVRLTKGDYGTKKVYGNDPLEMAKRFEQHGFQRLHLVDLDGAKAGKVINLPVLEAISNNTNLKVDFGGGIKSDEDLASVMAAGAYQVTIGSLAVKDPSKVGEWIDRFGAEKIILGADVKDRMVAIGGWLETSSLELFDLIQYYYNKGVRDVLCTDISKDGMLEGPAFSLYDEIMQKYPDILLIASGGVSGIEDVRKLKDAGIPSVVIGKAIYEGRIDLNELVTLND